MAGYNEEFFNKQLEGLPPRVMGVIALRAAMRVLPALAYRQKVDAGPFAYWSGGEQAQHALALFRCYQVSAFINSLTKASYAAARFAHPKIDPALAYCLAAGRAIGAAGRAAFAAGATTALDVARAAVSAANVANRLAATYAGAAPRGRYAVLHRRRPCQLHQLRQRRRRRHLC